MQQNDPMNAANQVARELNQPEGGKGARRLAADLAEARPCVECGAMTTGSTGAAGIFWPMLCQQCKDTADAAELLKAKRTARIADAIFRDDGDAFLGTLPLAILGQGEYRREVMP